MEKNKKEYYSLKEVTKMCEEFYTSPFINTRDYYCPSITMPRLDELNTSYKELVKNFYNCYFDQNFSIIHKIPNEAPRIIDVFDLPVIDTDKDDSFIRVKPIDIDDNSYVLAFEKIVLKNNNDIFTAIKYAHEIAHALTERNVHAIGKFDHELIPIVMELLFAYDIDTELSNYSLGEDGLYHNKFNPTATYDGEEFNYDTVKEILKLRINCLYALEELYQNETDEKKLNEYSTYIKSTIDALDLFNNYVEGDISLIANVDDLLRGKKRIKKTKNA